MKTTFKKLLCALLLVLSCAFFVSLCAQEKKPVKVETVKTVIKSGDPVAYVKDGLTYYKGSKGGIYTIRTSKKTGNQYKQYVKKAN